MLRVMVFTVGLMILALGIDLNTKTLLGISPINSVPYNVSALSGIPLGVCVYMNNVFFLFLQWLLLRRNFHPVQLLQLLTSLVNSMFVQIFDDHIPVMTGIWSRMGMLLLAIVITAVGICLTAGMELIPNPGEGAAGAVGVFLDKDFGFGKNILDISCVIASIMITLLFSHSIQNIGVGTLLSMILTGRCVKLFFRWTDRLRLICG